MPIIVTGFMEALQLILKKIYEAGKRYNGRTLRSMRQFYVMFNDEVWKSLVYKLSWTTLFTYDIKWYIMNNIEVSDLWVKKKVYIVINH